MSTYNVYTSGNHARVSYFRLWRHLLFVSRVHMQLPGLWLRRSCLLFGLLWPLGEKRRKLLGGFSPSTPLPSPSTLPPPPPLYLPLLISSLPPLPPYTRYGDQLKKARNVGIKKSFFHWLCSGGPLLHYVLYLCPRLLVRLCVRVYNNY